MDSGSKLTLAEATRNPLALGSEERDQADAAFIAAVARALREWEMVTGAKVAQKPLREAVWFYWERHRLHPALRSHYPRKGLWSPAARAAVQAGLDRNNLVIDHSEPIGLLMKEMVENELGTENMLKLLRERASRWVVLTKHENKKLAGAGVAQKMPPDWHAGDDPMARYRAAGFDPESFAPLDAE